MAYNDDKTWDDLAREAGNAARNSILTLEAGEMAYTEWQSFRAGRTNAQIATALSVAETDVAAMDSCYSAMHTLYQCAGNVDVSQGDYFYSLRIFS